MITELAEEEIRCAETHTSTAPVFQASSTSPYIPPHPGITSAHYPDRGMVIGPDSEIDFLGITFLARKKLRGNGNGRKKERLTIFGKPVDVRQPMTFEQFIEIQAQKISNGWVYATNRNGKWGAVIEK